MPAPRSRTGWRRSGPWYPLLACGVAGVLAAPAALAADSGAQDAKDPRPAAQQAELKKASEQAAKTHRRVEVQSQRTPTAHVYANPNGTYTTELHLPATRAPRGGVGLWTSVNKKYPNTSYWAKTGKDARVGHENQTGGTWRSYITMNSRDLHNTGPISRARFRILNTWSWSCRKTPVQIRDTGTVNQHTTWNSPVNRNWDRYRVLDTVVDAKGPKGCPAANLYFNVTRSARAARDNKWPTMTLGLGAQNETDTYGWKKFDATTSTLIVDWARR
ncbi:hypothetical protein ACH4FX_33985 [Streptomyces sp. NPDC018019]|uniref:hypothetical protein n=1 Tax=Streptomyces sp. NPDC018019 TaxID=3365030 RepID=UPI00378B235D